VKNQQERVERFRALHAAAGSFVIPNVWDGGSAAIMAGLGFPALATSSAACAATLGRLDGQITRAEALEHARQVIAATTLPVSADLENGFGAAPEAAAETIRLAGEVGLAGGSIEDSSGDERAPIYDFSHAVARVTAAVEAARRLPAPFVLTARAENFIHGRADLDDKIRRLQAFEKAGADVLFAPCLPAQVAFFLLDLVCLFFHLVFIPPLLLNVGQRLGYLSLYGRLEIAGRGDDRSPKV
jgi:2-methylisocitrate lyase-like PEP mutase family enzyme